MLAPSLSFQTWFLLWPIINQTAGSFACIKRGLTRPHWPIFFFYFSDLFVLVLKTLAVFSLSVKWKKERTATKTCFDHSWVQFILVHFKSVRLHTEKCVCLHKHFFVIPPHVLTDISPMEKLFKLKWALLHPYIYAESKCWHDKNKPFFFIKQRPLCWKGWIMIYGLRFSVYTAFTLQHWSESHFTRNDWIKVDKFNLSANFEKPL